MPEASLAQPDISLGLDDEGIVREASLSAALPDETVDGWVGRSWSDLVGETSAHSVRRMVEDARSNGVSAFRLVVQRFPSGREISVEYTAFRSAGASGGMVALGKNVQAVSDLQSRLSAARQATERGYWKLRDVETRYRMLFDASSEAVLTIDGEEGRVVEANPAAVRALGLAPGWDFAVDLSAAEKEKFAQMLARAREQGRAPGIVLHMGAEGAAWAVRASVMQGEPALRYLLHVSPAGPRRTAEATPATGLAELVASLPDGFLVLDPQGVVLLANEAFAGMAQAGTAAAVQGRMLGQWLSEPGADAAALLDTLRRHPVSRLFRTTLHGDLGSVTDVELSACRHGGQLGIVVRDIGRRLPDTPAADTRAAAGPPVVATPSGATPDPAVVDAAVAQLGQVPLLQAVRTAADAIERKMIRVALDRVDGNRTAAAELLGLSRQSLHTKLSRFASGESNVGSARPGE